jgi:hypothetical protein
MSKTEWSTIEPGSPPEEEKVEFEIEGQEEKQEAQEAQQPEPVEEKQEEAPATEEVKEVEGVETSGAQKRIRQLVSQRKEREAQIEQLLQQQKEMQIKLQQREQEYQQLLNTNIESNERQVTERIELAKDAYRQAVESGDADKIVNAQTALNNAQNDFSRLSDFRKQAEDFKPVEYSEQEQQQQTYSNAYVAEAQQKAADWAAENTWFNKDRVLTAAALAIDEDVKNEGYNPADDDYYQEINRRLEAEFPQKFGKAQEAEAVSPAPQAASQPAQVVAGASHTSTAPSNKKVKLSQEDVRLAEKWGISLEQYAAEKMKVEKAGEGEYTTINR